MFPNSEAPEAEGWAGLDEEKREFVVDEAAKSDVVVRECRRS